MKAPQPQTLAEALVLAAAIHSTVGMQRWVWAKHLARIAWETGTFQGMVDNDWEHLWTNEQCAAIAAMYRLTK